ncbi:hypothetical protein G9A89_012099 [Geosiphon pyriformis]|nr:hypothetical protein G9A89_012099 [Geosiphon pyriformis]
MVIGKKKIDLIINKVTAHTGVPENEKTDKLAKKATAFDTVEWAYNAKNELNIRHFLSQQTGFQAALDWISNDKVQRTLGPLDQEINWKCTIKVWNWDGKMSSGFTSAGSLAMCTFIIKLFHNIMPTAEVLYNRCSLMYLNNLCKVCKTLMDKIKNEWIQCLLKAVGEKHKTINSDKKIVLAKEYIMLTPNIDLLCKKLINK